MDSLRDDGFLAQAGQRRKPGPGRPEIACRLTLPASQSLPRDYESMPLPLLESIQEGEYSDNLTSLLAEMQVEQGEAFNACIRNSAQYLERNGYLPEALQTISDVTISLQNWPFFEAGIRHTQVCAFNIALLSTCIANHTDSHKGCRFLYR